MNWKLAAAFAAGATLAAGIVYLSVRPDVPKTVPSAEPLTAQAPVHVAPAHAAPPVHEKLSPRPVREKPSPMPPPARRADPIRIAHDDLPASAAPRIDP